MTRIQSIARADCLAAREYDGIEETDWDIDKLASQSLDLAIKTVSGHSRWYDSRDERREAMRGASRTASLRRMRRVPLRREIADEGIPEEALNQAALSLRAYGGGRTGVDEVDTIEEALSPHLRIELLEAMEPDLVGEERLSARSLLRDARVEARHKDGLERRIASIRRERRARLLDE